MILKFSKKTVMEIFKKKTAKNFVWAEQFNFFFHISRYCDLNNGLPVFKKKYSSTTFTCHVFKKIK